MLYSDWEMEAKKNIAEGDVLYKNLRWIYEKKANSKIKQNLWSKHLFLSIQEVNIFLTCYDLDRIIKILSSFCQAHSSWVIEVWLLNWKGT